VARRSRARTTQGFATAVTLLLLLIRHHLFALAIYPFYTKASTTTALLSMGQFTLETITLSLMTTLTWRFATQPTIEL
jgi:hypothetical protein